MARTDGARERGEVPDPGSGKAIAEELTRTRWEVGHRGSAALVLDDQIDPTPLEDGGRVQLVLQEPVEPVGRGHHVVACADDVQGVVQQVVRRVCR